MHIVYVDADKVYPTAERQRDIIIDHKAELAASTPSSYDREDIASDAPYRGKKTFGSIAHRAGINLFEPYGKYPPPPAKPMPFHDYPDDFLRSLLHPEKDRQRARDVDTIASTPSLFDRNLLGRPVPRMYDPDRIHPFAENYNPVRDSKGLLGGITEKSSDASPILSTGKRLLPEHHHSILTPDPYKPIPGFPGVAVGQLTKYDRMDLHNQDLTRQRAVEHQRRLDEIKEVVQRSGRTSSPYTDELARLARQRPTQLPPLGPPGLSERSDDGRPKADDFDPLRFKKVYHSPGDPANGPHRVKMIDIGPEEAKSVLRGEAATAENSKPAAPPTGTKHFPEWIQNDMPGVVPGFSRMGRESREDQRPHGRRLLAPDGVHPSRSKCKSCIF